MSQATLSEAAKSQLLKKIYEDNVHVLDFVLKRFRFSEQDNEDLLQEVFLRFYLNIDQVDVASASLPLTAARNVAIDHYRSKKTRQTFHDLKDALQVADTPTQESAQRRARQDIVREFIDKVRAEGGELLELYYSREMTVKEIAELSCESVGTITSRLTRLRRKYKAELQTLLEA